MTRQLSAAAIFACALITTACNQAPAPLPAPPDTREADAKAIKDIEAAWNKEFEAKDLDKLVAHYTDDATFMAPGMPVTNGKESIKKALVEFLKDPALALSFQSSRVEVAKSGDLAFSQGTYTMVMTNPATKKPMTDKGSFVTVYSKQADGTWKALEDINTSDAPPAPPKK